MKGRWGELAGEEGARGDLRTWVLCGCAVGVGVLASVGLLLLTRRLEGAFTADLPAGMLVATALAAGILILGGRWLWRRFAATADGEETDLIFGWAGTAALVLVAAGCSLGRLADWLLWVPLIAIEQTQLRWFAPETPRRRLGVWSPVEDVHEHEAEQVESSESPDVGGDEERPRRGSRRFWWRRESASETPPTVAETNGLDSGGCEGVNHSLAPALEGGGIVLQQLFRVRDELGVERVHGTLMAEFLKGQRQATMYVGFCPPLAHVPVVEVETVDGPEAELKVAQALCHGARLDVRLARPASEACAVVVELMAAPQGACEDACEATG